MIRKQTGNIYNDFESYRYPDIFNRINIMLCNTRQEIEWNKKEGYNNNKCELVVKIKNELDARSYKYYNINSLLSASYFIWLLDKTDISDQIELFQIFINDEISYVFDYWRTENEQKLNEIIEEQETKLQEIENVLKRFNHNIESFLKQYKTA